MTFAILYALSGLFTVRFMAVSKELSSSPYEQWLDDEEQLRAISGR